MVIENSERQLQIELPNGVKLSCTAGTSIKQLANEISPDLARQAVVANFAGELYDLEYAPQQSGKLQLITRKQPEALTVLRHDLAHVMAQAVQELFPETRIAFGPAIENGFYYDFASTHAFNSDDFAAIESRMHEIVDLAVPFTREVWPRQQAIEYFQQHNEGLKAEHIASLPPGLAISIYRQGDWLDLCRGPHSPNTKYAGHNFKLMSVAGAYWKGNVAAPMLQRIYATAWLSNKDLQAHLTMLEQAAARDHRRLGKELELFHLQDVAAGSVFWHPRGWRLYRKLEEYLRRKLEASGYQEIKTPQLVNQILWQQSGHWEKFRSDMYTVLEQEKNNRSFALKPMNCPCHVQVFKQGMVSYRDLPLRLAEFGSCIRNEPSGALHGLMRVRAFTQDDAHIFCREDQIQSETSNFCQLLAQVYRDLGFPDFHINFSTRPEIRAGDDATWDRAETALAEATRKAGFDYTINPGEGAFYGPKLEFVLRDALNREWQCGTLQVDFVLPERLDANYISANGSKQRPVMLHRAILGSFERFIGIMIEHYAGNLPAWLAPNPVVIATITDKSNEYAERVQQQLLAANIPALLDSRNEKINFKIREHSSRKIPQIWAIGERESATATVNVRIHGSRKTQSLTFDQALTELVKSITPPDLAPDLASDLAPDLASDLASDLAASDQHNK